MKGYNLKEKHSISAMLKKIGLYLIILLFNILKVKDNIYLIHRLNKYLIFRF